MPAVDLVVLAVVVLAALRRAPGLPDRALGVVAHAAVALVVCVAVGAVVDAVGPAPAARAADASGLLTVVGDRLPAVSPLAAAGIVR